MFGNARLEDFVFSDAKFLKKLPDTVFFTLNVLAAKYIDVENNRDDTLACWRNNCLVDQELAVQIFLRDTKLHEKTRKFLG